LDYNIYLFCLQGNIVAKNGISIGVQAACMVDCEVRVPLMVFAKLRGIDVKDPVDLAIVRPGRLIHAVFDAVATKMATEGRITDAAAVKDELVARITTAVPEMEAGEASIHATMLATAIHEVAIAEPTAIIAHERRVSVPLSTKAKLAGRIDTITKESNGWVIVERKSGEERTWHAKQVQLYAEMLVAQEPDARIARLELWYSRYGKKEVNSTSGELLRDLIAATGRGEAFSEQDAVRVVDAWCASCPRMDCGVKRLVTMLSSF
jgi:predicted RecB family nuclease